MSWHWKFYSEHHKMPWVWCVLCGPATGDRTSRGTRQLGAPPPSASPWLPRSAPTRTYGGLLSRGWGGGCDALTLLRLFHGMPVVGRSPWPVRLCGIAEQSLTSSFSDTPTLSLNHWSREGAPSSLLKQVLQHEFMLRFHWEKLQ